MIAAPASLRLDKWLWHARFFKTRTLAAKVVASGGVRVNGTRVTKAAVGVRPTDVLTFAQGQKVRVVRIAALGVRRGPAPEAQALYEDIAPPAAEPSPGSDRKGRPTKKDRRALDQNRDLTP